MPIGGGISRREEVFYNPHMALNRDATVALCRLLKPATFCDVMAGSGARGIRAANEAGVKVTLNDLNPVAVELIGENAQLNGVEVEVVRKGARQVLSERVFDYVDLDPFGTPVEYTEAAVAAVKGGGILGVAATDTSALSGTYPRACKRKYDAVSLRCDCYDEVGLRILLGFIARTALRLGRGVKPVFSHSTRHYMRAQVKVTCRPKDTIEHIGYLRYCTGCLRREYVKLGEAGQECGCGGRVHVAGPLWTDMYADEGVCKQLAGEVAQGRYERKKELVRLAQAVGEEQSITVPYYDLHKLCKKYGVAAPKTEALKEHVASSGYGFVRTHYSPTGFRTEMPVEELSAFLKK